MDYALGMHDDLHTANVDPKEPACLDHLQPFVEQGSRVDRDFPAHHPGRMFERAFDGEVRKLFFWCRAKWAAGSGQPKAPHRAGRLVVQALEDGGVFAIDRQHAHAMFGRFAHYRLARHNQNFLRGDRDIFAGADGGQGRLQAGGADDGDEHDVCRRQRGEFDQAIASGIDPRRGAQHFFEFPRFGRVQERDGFGPVFERLFGEQFRIAARRQAHESNAVGQVLGHPEGAGADGPGAAEEDNVLHMKNGVVRERDAGVMV